METIKKWLAKIDAYKAKVNLGQPLTEEEEADWDFMEQKLDDWRTDWYGNAGL